MPTELARNEQRLEPALAYLLELLVGVGALPVSRARLLAQRLDESPRALEDLWRRLEDTHAVVGVFHKPSLLASVRKKARF